MWAVRDLLFKSIKEINFDQCFDENIYSKLHGLLNVLLLFESHCRAWDLLNDKLSQVLLYCALIVYIFLENLWVPGNANPWFTPAVFIRIYLIRITRLTNNIWIFCSSLKLLHFDLIGEAVTTNWTIFICRLSFSFYCET